MPRENSLIAELLLRGVDIPAPEAVVVRDVHPENFESGVTIHPGTTVCGRRSRFGAGTVLGMAGGGYFEDVVCGRNVQLYGGYFSDCVFLDDVKLRGQAEVRGGTLLEEGCEGAHHVGFKMTVMLPWVIAGSLVNFCDALVAGGTSRKDHSEIGSTLALYNFTPRGDKFASLFGDVPRGIFLNQPPVFVGGQTQIVSPVRVGFGATLAAGAAVRRDVPAGRLYGESPAVVDRNYDRRLYSAVMVKAQNTVAYIGNLYALKMVYRHLRQPAAAGDAHMLEVYAAGERQLDAGIHERLKRLRKFAANVAESRRVWDELAPDGGYLTQRRLEQRRTDHDAFLSVWPGAESALAELLDDLPGDDDARDALAPLAAGFRASEQDALPLFLRDCVANADREAAAQALQRVIERIFERTGVPVCEPL